MERIMKFTQLCMVLTVFSVGAMTALEKAETADINPETASLARDFSGIRTLSGKTDSFSLGQRFGELKSKGTGRTAAEEKEYKAVAHKLSTQLYPKNPAAFYKLHGISK